MEQIHIPNFTLEDLPKMVAYLARKVERLEQQLNQHTEKQNKGNAILNRKEAADLLKISLPTLANLTKEGKFKWYKNGQKMFFDYFNVVEYIENQNTQVATT
jgi:excisionase family DNA binding protein